MDLIEDCLLHTNTPESNARLAALKAGEEVSITATSIVAFQSKGYLLVYADSVAEAALIVAQLAPFLHCVISAPDAENTTCSYPTHNNAIHFNSAHLGHFDACTEAGASIIQKFYPTKAFDLVLNISKTALFTAEIPPLGYYAPQNEEELEQCLQDLPEMIGEFDKPKYFHYNSEQCAHSSSGQKGCEQCINACPTDAIISIGEKIEVNPNLCQGGGSCATTCPTGAITYNYPPLNDFLEKLRCIINTFRHHSEQTVQILFYDESSVEPLRAQLPTLPETVLPIFIEEVGAVGMETYLSCLAYGAQQVIVIHSDYTAPRVLTTLQTQIDYSQQLITPLGYPITAIQAQHSDKLAALSTSTVLDRPPARYSGMKDKRTVIEFALDHLYQHAPTPVERTDLSAGAPFGYLNINTETCTLCHSCVNVCPSYALKDGVDIPQLAFIEHSCVQCGLCVTACPEQALSCQASYSYESETRKKKQVLHEEKPFHCISCQKPFGTEKMIQHMTEKLRNHSMFQGDALKRLQMCEDCRVKDMF